MKYRLCIVVCASIMLLAGCGKDTSENTNVVSLAPPTGNNTVSVVNTEDNTADVEDSTEDVTYVEKPKVTNRTKIMVSSEGEISKEPTVTDEPENEEYIEEDTTLQRFKKNMSKITLPKNGKVTCKIESELYDNYVMGYSYMDNGATYVYMDYDDSLLEMYIEDINDSTKPLYINLKTNSTERSGYAYATAEDAGIDTMAGGSDDFEMTSINDVLKNGGNYNISGSFIWNNEQYDGTVTVGENYTVYNIECEKDGDKLSASVQTLLKMPVTKSNFSNTEFESDDVIEIIFSFYAGKEVGIDNIKEGVEDLFSTSSAKSTGTVNNEIAPDTGSYMDNNGNLQYTVTNTLKDDTSVISIKKDIAGNIISTEVFDIYFDGNKYFVCATFQCDENILGSDINNAWNDTKQTVPYMTQNGNISFRDEGTTFHIECSTDRLAGLTEFYDRLIATSEKSSSPILSWDY